ncbi:MAG: proton-conducting membrane transporter, partial [Lachnospiraceae bacterium]|nr:proton-conducting membrane transporter [Lachnospiraceae bacterium]
VIRAFFPGRGFDSSSLEGIKDPNWKMLTPLFIFTVFIIFFGLYSGPVTRFFTDVAGGVY